MLKKSVGLLIEFRLLDCKLSQSLKYAFFTKDRSFCQESAADTGITLYSINVFVGKSPSNLYAFETLLSVNLVAQYCPNATPSSA